MKYLLIAGLTFLFSCQGKGDKQPKAPATDSTRSLTSPMPQKEITDTLLRLDFVRKSQAHIDSISGHRHGISFITDTTTEAFYIKAGYNREDRFETYHDFMIDRKTGEIRVMDIVEGSYIPLTQYLTQQK